MHVSFILVIFFFFFFSSRRRHTRSLCDWSSDVCSSDLAQRITRRNAVRLQPLRGRRWGDGRPGRGSVWLPVPSTAAATDRKSTRLNSSHTVISYAVFCLKKKKQENYN